MKVGKDFAGPPQIRRTDLPLVSICIPAYNVEPFIRETLDSALAQDYPNLEIILSDDASTDGTVEIVTSYESKGVRLLKQEKNLGMTRNMNAVIRASQGKYVLKLDGDDTIEPQYVSSMVPVMEAHPRVAFAHCACRLIDKDSKFLGYERSIHGSFIRAGLKEWPRYIFGPRAVHIIFIRREPFEKVGGYNESFHSQDWKLERDLLLVGDVYYNDQVLASYRVHNIGKSRLAWYRAHDHLLHLDDIERLWPPEVPDKKRLMPKIRRCRVRYLLDLAAFSNPEEAQELLKILPQYGRFPSLLPSIWLIRMGGAGLLRLSYRTKWHLRQMVKNLLYKRSG
ncbi:MAG: glycosyltransferase family 2 protein [Thermodesulfobacteriota bacterium]